MTDDRGAIMVMGIFMCSCLVGALWYLAGLGDAILYRERLQEAADAVAFSDAALHARGMNLLVLINLIMACVLGIRVALRTAKIVLVIASAVFAAASVYAPPLAAAAGATSSAAEVLQSVGGELDPAIDVALQGLNGAQDGIAKATPILAATAARESVGDLYEPTVKRTSTQELAGLGASLPVEHVDPTVLCKHAAASLPDFTKWLLKQTPLGELAAPLGFITPIMVAMAGADPDDFCGLSSSDSSDSSDGGNGGSNGGGGNGGDNKKTAPAIEAELEKNAAQICKDIDLDQVKGAFEKKEAEWLAECAKAGMTCQSRDPKTDVPLKAGSQTGHTSLVRPDKQDEQFVLDELLLERDQDLRTFRDLQTNLPAITFDKSACVVLEKADLKLRRAEQLRLVQRQPKRPPSSQNQPSGQSDDGSSSSSGTTASMAVIKKWHNGAKEAQIIGGALGDDTLLQRSGNLVRVATVPKKTPQVSAPEAASIPAVAQAELFYDCGGTWSKCNADEEAMWSFRWRARLRRFNQPWAETLGGFVPPLVTTPPRMDHDAFADKLAQDALGNDSFDSNAALRRDLANSLSASDDHTHAHGVH